jgi:hypothetical protein
MASRTVTLIDESRPVEVEGTVGGDAIHLTPEGLARALGWEVKPRGLCRGDACVPVRDVAALVRTDGIDVVALARLLDRPLAIEAAEGIAVLGASAGHRAARLASLEAPDFTLPDLDGGLHSLHAQRGRKTLLVAWASW